MKKYIKIAGGALAAVIVVSIAVFALLCWLFFGVLLPFYNVPNANKTVAVYNPQMGLVSEQTLEALENSKYSKKYELGINKAGEVVFKHPIKAWSKSKSEYKECWKYADKKLHKKHISRTYYIKYIGYMDEVAKEKPELKEQAEIYAEILEIYSRSYNKHR
ncbi:MAG: hypothetical protein GX241_05040 [Ruminococcaceae bacterium]|nr:hypothetical protein [Oscillospiraceae bacterium]